jgi:orotate phosphoribosyltransferase
LAADALGDLDHDTFDMAVGLEYSGILFASAVAGGKKVGIVQKDGGLFGPSLKGLRVIIVDDVVHTGEGICEAAAIVEKAGGMVVGFACIVDRSGGRFTEGVSTSSGVRPLFSAFQTDME